jgi:hypothetical protein
MSSADHAPSIGLVQHCIDCIARFPTTGQGLVAIEEFGNVLSKIQNATGSGLEMHLFVTRCLVRPVLVIEVCLVLDCAEVLGVSSC